MQTKKSIVSGFTLVEILIVVSIIGVLAAVAIPGFKAAMKKSTTKACITTLKTIQGSKMEWALDHKKADTDVPSDADLFGDGKYVDNKPECPAGGTYDLKSVGEKATCTIPGHAL